MTFVEGNPGQGKSFVTCAIAKSLSIGEPLHGESLRSPCNVLIFNYEDSIPQTIVPRLRAMGADTTKISAYKDPLSLDSDGQRNLENAIANRKPSIVFLDPLSAVLGAEIDMYKPNHVRPFMRMLSQMAEKHDCAIVVVRHLTKGGQDSPIYRGTGSIDFVGACRSAILVGSSPLDESQRALIHIKSNLGPIGESVGYKLDNGKFEWTGKSELRAEDLLTPHQSSDDRSALQEANEFLTDFLRLGAQGATKVMSEADARGISKATLRRAKKILKIKDIRVGEDGKKGGGSWLWKLPDLDAHGAHVNNLSTLITKPVNGQTDFQEGLI